MALDNEALEAAAAGIYENAWQGGTIEVLNAGASVIASGSIPNSNNKDLAGSPNGVVGNDVVITIVPSSNDTAANVRIKDAGGDVRNTYTASSVLNSVNVVLGNNITVPVNNLTATVS